MKASFYSLFLVLFFAGSVFLSSSLAKSAPSPMETMVKNISAREKLPQKKVKALARELFLQIRNQLKQGKKVTLRGFGTFYVGHQKSRTWKNPRTKKIFQLPARKTIRFRASQKLKKFLNDSGKK